MCKSVEWYVFVAILYSNTNAIGHRDEKLSTAISFGKTDVGVDSRGSVILDFCESIQLLVNLQTYEII